MNLNLENKNILITGGSRGLGEKLAYAFAEEGCRVSIISRSKKDCLNVMKNIGGANNGHFYSSSNLLKKKNINTSIKNILNYFKKIDIVVHNVGGALGYKDPLENLDNWMKVWMFNVGISIEINNILIPKMIIQGGGKIINISSSSSIDGLPANKPFGGSIQYSCAKSYLNMYTKCMAREYADKNISFSAVLPGPFLSPGKHWDKLKSKNKNLFNKFIKSNNPLKRFSKFEDIIPFVLLLASEKSSFSNGSLIPINGGA